MSYKKSNFSNPDQASIIEASYCTINKALVSIMTEFKIAS